MNPVDDPRGVADIFDPRRLRQARLVTGLQQAELAARVGVTAPAISQYERGYAVPSPPRLLAIALALGFPVGFFGSGRQLVDASTEMTFFRRQSASTVRARTQALTHAELLWEVAAHLERYVELPPPMLPQLVTREADSPEDVQAIAQEIRRMWKIPGGPIADMVRLLEAHGVVVGRLLGDDRVDAFSCRTPSRPVVLMHSNKGDRARSRFDAAHELGHLVMHGDDGLPLGIAETQAHWFAAELLLPANEIRCQLPARVDFNRLLQLKRTWGVSLQALLYRAKQLEVISPKSYQRAMATMGTRGWRADEPGYLGPPERPSLLMEAFGMASGLGLQFEDLVEALKLPTDLVIRIVFGEEGHPEIFPRYRQASIRPLVASEEQGQYLPTPGFQTF